MNASLSTQMQDSFYMQKAQALALEALYITDPNPRVGCVIVKNNKIIGQGFTQKSGEAHAEVMALHDAKNKGYEQDIKGATFYVTLEPCSHFGRTPPCTDTLIKHGAARVVIACLDPNPLVAGKGVAKLQQAGIQVDYPLMFEETLALNPGFMSRMVTGMPWTWSKLACSLDGKLALENGVSQWITGTSARADGQRWRARSSAVVTGIGTVLADNPLLNVRLFELCRQPLRIILDGEFCSPIDAAIFNGDPVLVVTYTNNPEKQIALQDKGVEVWVVDEAGIVNCSHTSKGINKHLNLHYIWTMLAQRGINEIHVEAGSGLNSALLQAGLIDELLVYMAPKIIGSGRGLFQLPIVSDLRSVHMFEWIEQLPIGEDLRLRLRNPKRWSNLVEQVGTTIPVA